MTDAGGGAVQHGGIELLGDLAGHLHEVLALLGIAGLDHGDLGGAGIVAVVLLVLGGMATGVVSGDDDVSAVHAHVAGGEQGVGGDVQADHLHRADGAGAGHGGAVGDLGRDLLVGSPLAVHILLVLGQILQNLGAGRSGISGTDLDTGFVDATGGGLVTGHQMLHVIFHLSFCLLYFHYLIRDHEFNRRWPPARRGARAARPRPESASPPRRACGSRARSCRRRR